MAPLSESKPKYELTNVNFWGWARHSTPEFSGYRALLTAEAKGHEGARRYAYALMTDHEYAQAVLQGDIREYQTNLVRLAYRVLDGTDEPHGSL